MNRGKDTPLGASVQKDVLTVQIGIDVVKFAHEEGPYWDMGKVSDPTGFAIDVRNALMSEREDGSSLLTDAFDAAIVKAIEDGSMHFDHAPNRCWANPVPRRRGKIKVRLVYRGRGKPIPAEEP